MKEEVKEEVQEFDFSTLSKGELAYGISYFRLKTGQRLSGISTKTKQQLLNVIESQSMCQGVCQAEPRQHRGCRRNKTLHKINRQQKEEEERKIILLMRQINKYVEA